MRGPQVLRQVVAWCSQLLAQRQDFQEDRRLGGERVAAPWALGEPLRQRRARRWLQVGLLGCLVSGLVAGIGPNCITPDPEYCDSRAQCPYADTPLGPMQLFCHSTRHVCLPSGGGICSKDEDCPDSSPRCDLATNACTSCRVGDSTDQSCARFTDRPLCGNAADGSGTTLCLSCRNNLDCPSNTPICDTQQCRKCTAHSDCEGALKCDDGNQCSDSLVCIGEGDLTADLVGSCAQNGTGTGTGTSASGRVVYVNSTDPVCQTAGTPPPASYGNQFSTPLCDLGAALTLARTKAKGRFIRIVGQYTGSPGSVMDGSYSFIGAPAKGSQGRASIMSRGMIFSVSGTAGLTLDQLDILEITSNSVPISCTGNATGAVPKLTLRGSTLRGSMLASEPSPNQAALSISNCTTLIDGNVIGVAKLADLTDPTAAAHGQGIYIADARHDGASSYLIQNNIIAGNIGVALHLGGTGGGTPKFVVRFNTIVGNGRGTPNISGAVFCDPAASLQEFSHSIVSGNSFSIAEHSQFASPSGCGVKDLVVGPTEGSMLPAFIHKDPGVNATFHLNPNLSQACIDQVLPVGNETLPSQDIDGTKRPQNTKWDIGAVELKQ